MTLTRSLLRWETRIVLKVGSRVRRTYSPCSIWFPHSQVMSFIFCGGPLSPLRALPSPCQVPSAQSLLLTCACHLHISEGSFQYMCCRSEHQKALFRDALSTYPSVTNPYPCQVLTPFLNFTSFIDFFLESTWSPVLYTFQILTSFTVCLTY